MHQEKRLCSLYYIQKNRSLLANVVDTNVGDYTEITIVTTACFYVASVLGMRRWVCSQYSWHEKTRLYGQ
jgi:hypothetical protein